MTTAKQIRHAILRSADELATTHPDDVDVRCARFVARLSGWLDDDPAIKKALYELLGWDNNRPTDGA